MKKIKDFAMSNLNGLSKKLIITRHTVFIALIFTTLLFGAFITYYFSVNTVFGDRVLPNVSLNGENVSFKTKAELESDVQPKYLSNFPESVKFKYKDKEFEVKTADLNPKLSTDYILAYGKGNNIGNVLGSIPGIVSGVNFDVVYEVNFDSIIPNLPFKVTDKNAAKVVNGKVENCNSNEYSLSINKEAFQRKISEALKNSTQVDVENSDLFSDLFVNTLFNLCDLYNLQSPLVQKAFSVFSAETEAFKLVSFKSNVEGKAGWSVDNEENLRELLTQHKTKFDAVAQDGEYEERDGKLFLFKPFVVGKALKVEDSLNQIKIWLQNPNETLPLAYDETKPAILDLGKDIIDFTSVYAQGESRINLYFGEYVNPYVPNSRVGLDEAEGYVISPGQEFSFYNLLGPTFTDTWRTRNGGFIGSGICNSSTTLFRAALNAGFPILERYNHAWNVPKYDWPYEMNLVDAAYLTMPKADMRFLNDLDYPVLIKREYSQDSEYEYQKVTFLTDPRAKKREVTLHNFRMWDIEIPGSIFKGSFDRTVKQDGVVIREDNFYSHYTVPYGQ